MVNKINNEVIRPKKRLANFELLRILSMFMVLMLHTRIPNALTGTFGELLWRSFSACGVDTFVLISGYFGLKPSIKSWVHFLLPPAFYTLVLCTINKEPLTHYQPWCSWWFVTCYLELLLLAPFINSIIDGNNKVRHIFLIGSLTIINIYFGFICQTNEGRTGYTLMNFCYLYTIGRYIKIHVSLNKSVFVRLSFFMIIVFTNGLLRYFDLDIKGITFYYNSPLVILQAISLLLVFEQIRINKVNKIIFFLSSSTFSVYLISDHPLFRYDYYSEFWQFVDNNSIINFFILALFFNLIIFIVCILIDKLRCVITDRFELYLVRIIDMCLKKGLITLRQMKVY